MFAVVGPRKVSDYGVAVTEMFVELLSKYFMIISGLALGVDTISHKVCLQNNQYTIAVLATGLDRVYPKQNIYLFNQISDNSLLLSEFYHKAHTQKYHFLQRNRIIAALSTGVLLTEAALNSGAMSTARFAVDQGKDVFSVPGSIFSKNTEGVHSLIKDGANCVTSPQEILEYYGCNIQEKSSAKLSQKETEFLTLFTSEKTNLEDLFDQLNWTVPEIIEMISELEIKGLIKEVETDCYIKTV